VRRAVTVFLAASLAASACSESRSERGADPLPSVSAMADDLGADVVRRLRRGYVPGRSGEILLVPRPGNVLGQWTGGLRGKDDPRTTHAAPWADQQRVPIILHGPPHVPSGVVSDAPADMADLAPTLAGLLRFPFRAPDGRPLPGALDGTHGPPPRAVVVVVYDGGGWNLLDHWRGRWPVLRELARRGITYVNATAGSAPSSTAPVHASLGTGAYPSAHGVSENTIRLPRGELGNVYFERADTRLLAAPTLADAWDRANGNRPWVGMLGYEDWHLGMMGRGAGRPGGDRDVAILWEYESGRFWTNPVDYRLPAGLPPRAVLDERLRALDGRDGVVDGRWLSLDLKSSAFMPASPAFVEYQARALAGMLRGEPIGEDAMTDLLFVTLKSSDIGGHAWNLFGAEEGRVLAAQDRALRLVVSSLDREVGRGRWVLALTADHGLTPLPPRVGGLRIDRFELGRDVDRHFGAPIVETVHPSQLYLREEELRRAGITVEDVARYLGGYRYGDGIPPGTPLDRESTRRLAEPVLAGALPGSYLSGLTDEAIDALGVSRWDAGDLTSPPAYGALLRD
jgi:Type I phosphodiesterase / nucleotide pyrophosphatase